MGRQRQLIYKGLIAPLLASVFLTSPLPVFAQQGSTELEELIITARRRSESILDAPLTVTAFSSQDVIDAGIERVEDFLALTPNVTIATSQGIGTSFITVRGIAQVRNGEPPVAVIVDGVLQFTAAQIRQELFDIDSIEVVKGPQGAYYGRNATGGAIIINTKRPADETESYVELGVGNGGEYSLQASAGGKLSDGVYGQWQANYIDRDGYLYNITRQEKADRFEDTVVRGRLIFEPGESFSADFRASVQSHKGRGIGFQFQGVNIAPDGITASGFGTDTGPVDANNVLPVRDNNMDTGERDMTDLSMKLTWNLDIATLVATTGYADIEEWADSDQFPYTNARSAPEVSGFDGTQTGFFVYQGLSQEIRLSSPDDQPIRWEIGAYYLDWERFASLATGTDTGQGILRVTREPLTDPRNPTTSFLADDNSNTAKAIFASLNFDINDQIELALAGRYDKEERVQNVSPLQFPAGVPGARNEAEFDKFQPKATLRYKPDDDSNWYLTWGEGFRSGQFNQNGIAAVAEANGLIGVTDLVDQEESSSFEIGYKGVFADNRLRLNAALFNTEVENQQFFSFIGAISAQILTSIDAVTLQGGEVDLTYAASENWSLYAAYGFTDSEIDTYSFDPTAEGNDAPYVAENTFNIGAQYEGAIDSKGNNLFARLDVERRGEQFWDTANSTARDALTFVNAQIAVRDADDVWALTLEVENATDVLYNSEWVAGGFSARAPGRIYGLDLRYNF